MTRQDFPCAIRFWKKAMNGDDRLNYDKAFLVLHIWHLSDHPSVSCGWLNLADCYGGLSGLLESLCHTKRKSCASDLNPRRTAAPPCCIQTLRLMRFSKSTGYLLRNVIAIFFVFVNLVDRVLHVKSHGPHQGLEQRRSYFSGWLKAPIAA